MKYILTKMTLPRQCWFVPVDSVTSMASLAVIFWLLKNSMTSMTLLTRTDARALPTRFAGGGLLAVFSVVAALVKLLSLL